LSRLTTTLGIRAETCCSKTLQHIQIVVTGGCRPCTDSYCSLSVLYTKAVENGGESHVHINIPALISFATYTQQLALWLGYLRTFEVSSLDSPQEDIYLSFKMSRPPLRLT